MQASCSWCAGQHLASVGSGEQTSLGTLSEWSKSIRCTEMLPHFPKVAHLWEIFFGLKMRPEGDGCGHGCHNMQIKMVHRLHWKYSYIVLGVSVISHINSYSSGRGICRFLHAARSSFWTFHRVPDQWKTHKCCDAAPLEKWVSHHCRWRKSKSSFCSLPRSIFLLNFIACRANRKMLSLHGLGAIAACNSSRDNDFVSRVLQSSTYHLVSQQESESGFSGTTAKVPKCRSNSSSIRFIH
jgi:hypothetical protein